MKDECIAVIAPIYTRCAHSSCSIGEVVPDAISVNIKVESQLLKVKEKENTYVFNTIVSCLNDEIHLKIIVVLETVLYASGEMNNINNLIKSELRDTLFEIAEENIYNLSGLHGYPLKVKILQNDEK